MQYDFKKNEAKWQQKWEDAGVFHAVDGSDKPKFYALVEFPYPSGAGMHVGHIKAYSGLEVVSRKRRMEGYNVLFPIGFDAYGLPTENYAIKTGIHPRQVTDQNIAKFSSQLKRVGFSFDWNRVIDTTDIHYYKWTQWIFLKMFEHGLAFRDKTLVNYCPSCKVVLSNEDSQGGKCDICHSDIVQKSKDVWYLRITQYADKLLEGLDTVDYLPNVRLQQENSLLQMEAKRYREMRSYMDNTRSMRHDFRQHLHVITELARSGETEKLNEYLSGVNDAAQESLDRYCANLAVDAIASFYTRLSGSRDIRILWTLELPDPLPVDESDYCGLLGNLLDNAVNAVKDLPKERRNITVASRMLSDSMLGVSVENPYEGTLKLDAAGMPVSSRDNHGIGLASVAATVHKYHGSMDIRTNDNIFAVSILLYPGK